MRGIVYKAHIRDEREKITGPNSLEKRRKKEENEKKQKKKYLLLKIYYYIELRSY